MRNQLVAKRYIKAILMNLDASEYDDILADARLLKEVFSTNSDYVKDINSLSYPTQERLKVAVEITRKLAKQQLWENLFRILVKKHRFLLIEEILETLDEEILFERNQIRVNLTVAHRLSEDVIQSITAKVKAILKMEPVMEISYDPAIIGGFVAQTESYLIDGSIRNNLVNLTRIREKKLQRSV